jgi:hypothetical protein
MRKSYITSIEISFIVRNAKSRGVTLRMQFSFYPINFLMKCKQIVNTQEVSKY